MNKSDILLDAIASSTSSTIEEEHIVIGNDRIITVPKELERLAVQYDHDIETVTFDCPRYWDEHDMSIMTVYINYLCPDGTSGIYKAENLKVDEIDPATMHFDWTISKNVTNTPGQLAFLVCIKNTDLEGVEKNHWNSELCNACYVSEGLEYGEEEIRELIPDIIEQWHREVLAVTDEIKAARDNGEFKGDPGVSPTIQVTDINKGHRITITDVNGIKSFDVLGTIVDGTEAVNELLNQFVYKNKVFYATSIDGISYTISDPDVEALDGAEYVIRVNRTPQSDIEPVLVLADGSSAMILPKIEGTNQPLYDYEGWINSGHPLKIMYDDNEGVWIADVDIALASKLNGVIPPEKGGTGITRLDEIWKDSYTYSLIHKSNSIDTTEVDKTLDSARACGKYVMLYRTYKYLHPTEDMKTIFPFKSDWDACTLTIENLSGNGKKSIDDLRVNEFFDTAQTIESDSGEKYTRTVIYNKDGSISHNTGWIEHYSSISKIPISNISGISYGDRLPADSDSDDGNIHILTSTTGAAKAYIWLQDNYGWTEIN